MDEGKWEVFLTAAKSIELRGQRIMSQEDFSDVLMVHDMKSLSNPALRKPT